MPEPKEVPLPENSTELLRQVAPVLEEFFDFDRFVIGGGGVLAARWQHRRSFDVGLFTADSEGTMAIHQLGGQLRALAGVRCGDSVSVSTTPRQGEIVRGSRGIVEWAFVQRLTQRRPMLEVEPLTRMQLDCIEEILAQ